MEEYVNACFRQERELKTQKNIHTRCRSGLGFQSKMEKKVLILIKNIDTKYSVEKILSNTLIPVHPVAVPRWAHIPAGE